MTLHLEPYGFGYIARHDGQWVRFDLDSVRRDMHCLRNGVVIRSGNHFDEADLQTIKTALTNAARRRADR